MWGHRSATRRRLVGVTIGLALAVSACGGSDDSGERDSTTSDPSESSAGAETIEEDSVAEPASGGAMTIASGADAQPAFAMASRAGNYPWRRQVFDTLIVLDPETSEPNPLLATGWEFNDDATKVVLALRDDVTFHTGRAMTAADVVFSLEQAKLPENAVQTGGIIADATIEATGGHEVTITAPTSIANIFDVLELVVIVDQDTVAGLQDGTQVVGTGPFTWEKWEPGASLTLARYGDYWGGPAKLDSIEVVIITDSTAQVSALTSGRAQMATGLSNTDATTAASGNDNLALIETPGETWFPLGMDVTLPPFDDPVVRQAVGYAIDRERIVLQVFEGIGGTSDLWWKTNEPGMTDDLAHRYTYDPDRARQMLEDAGAVGAKIEFSTLNIPIAQSVFEIVQNNLSEVGLSVTPNVMETAIFDEQQAAGELGQIFLQIHGLQGFSPATLVDAFPALRDGNPSKFDPAEYRQLRDDLQAATLDEEEAKLVELTNYMLDEAFSHAIARTITFVVQSDAVQGVDYTNIGFWGLHEATVAS
jgi:peptide/nickel transport system substrate-binding protein